MRKRFLTFPLFLLAALILTVSVSASADAEARQMEIANRNDADGAFSCDVKLFGEPLQGSVYAALFDESGQMKRACVYPAAETVPVVLTNAADTDYIKIIWLDERYAPLVSAVLLRMSGNSSLAYEKFTEEFLESQKDSGGGGGGAALGSDDPYVLARLLVSCAELPDLSGYHVLTALNGPDNLHILQFNTAGEARACAEYLRTFSSVRYAEPDGVMQVGDEPLSVADADGAGLYAADALSWGAEAAGITEYAENLLQRGINSDILVAVVDSGADLEHPLLKDRLFSGFDFIDNDNAPQDGCGHGTHVSGIIADCTPGMRVKIMPVRVLDNYGTGSAFYISAGIRYAADHGANVINLSLSLKLGHSSYVEDAISYAISKNITVVVAAGNQNSDVKERCPAHMEECVTVAATDRNWRRFELSNYGKSVDIAAPGVEIKSSLPGGKYGEMTGTSMAAPHVAASAALLMEERGTVQTPAQISRALRDAAASLDVSDMNASGENIPFGAGFLNLAPFIIRAQQTVAFYPNGGTGTMTPQSAASGSIIALKSNAFSRDGYRFAGWNTNADGSGTSYADGATLTVNNNISLYAQWKASADEFSLSVAFQKYDEAAHTILDGEISTATTDDIIVATYSLKNNSGGNLRISDIQLFLQYPEDLLQAYPKDETDTDWDGPFYEYGYKALAMDGVINTELSGKTNIVLANQAGAAHKKGDTVAYAQVAYKVIRSPGNAVFSFDMKEENSVRSIANNVTTPRTLDVSGAFTLKLAQPAAPTVTFDGNGATSGSMPDQTFPNGATANLYANKYVRNGYQFAGWNTTPDGSGDAYADGVTLTVNKNITLYAQWEPDSVLYALLYADGELVFQNGAASNPGRTLAETYAIPATGAVSEYAKWYDRRADIQTVTFAEPVRPSSTALWFYGCANLTQIRNPENLDASQVTDMSQMFSRCASLTTLDLSALDTKSVTNTRQMFFQCAALNAIYASAAFDVSNVTESADMFAGCTSLIGGAGTKYDPAHTDKAYARVDGGASAPGYFTLKNTTAT